jgi:hypothetical protein
MMPPRPSAAALTRATGVAVVAGVTVAVIVAIAAWMGGSGGEPEPRVAAQTLAQSVTSAVPTEPPATASAPPRTCGTATRRFAPKTIDIPGVTRGASVVQPPRDELGVPGTPPLTTGGKSQFAWDRKQGTRPGDPAGNVLLNAHTWPDGSAMGNRLLAGLQKGDRIVVRGAGKRLCYRVTERVEVPADRNMPRYYATDGRPQLAIVVCSGRRLGPGVWTKRTVWFASPSV